MKSGIQSWGIVARWLFLLPCTLMALLLTAQIMEYFLASVTSIVGGSETNPAADLASTIIKLGLSFSTMILVASSMAPSHKSEVFRGACVFSLVYAALIAMMGVADGGPITNTPLPFLSVILAFLMVRQITPDEG